MTVGVSVNSVRLFRNPWERTVGTRAVRDSFGNTLELIGYQLQRDVGEGNKPPSCAFVVLDPTRSGIQVSPLDHALGAFLFGSDAEKYLSLALAAADVHRRHGASVDVLIEKAPFCLGDDDPLGGFSVGYSMEGATERYGRRLMIAGGAGLDFEYGQEKASVILNVLAASLGAQVKNWRAERPDADWLSFNGWGGVVYDGITKLPYS